MTFRNEISNTANFFLNSASILCLGIASCLPCQGDLPVSQIWELRPLENASSLPTSRSMRV